MKLKTLKDFEHPAELNYDAVSVYQLRQEAIKDIKELEKFNPFEGSNFPAIVSGYITNPKEIISYIKWKFNIKESELK